MRFKLFKAGHSPDYLVIAMVVMLTIFGLVMLASASFELGRIRYDDTLYYVKHQVLRGLLIGIVGFFVASKFYYRNYRTLALPFLLITLAALALVFTSLGSVQGGAGRWLAVGPITFQPAEFLKITYLLYLAAWLSNPKSSRDQSFFKGFVPFLIMTTLIGGMLVLQPATSTVAILLGTGLIVYFASGARMRYIGLLMLLGAIALGLLIYFSPYRLERVITFLHKDADTEDSGYHISEALTTLGSGRILGIGYGESPTKVGRLPASINDSIFAVIGSELGFVGAGALAAIFGFFTFRVLWLARGFRDRFGQLLLIGFGVVIGLQAFVNMAAISGLLPLTGVPLPFISFGGSALAVFLTMSGIIVNVSKFT